MDYRKFERIPNENHNLILGTINKFIFNDDCDVKQYNPNQRNNNIFYRDNAVSGSFAMNLYKSTYDNSFQINNDNTNDIDLFIRLHEQQSEIFIFNMIFNLYTSGYRRLYKNNIMKEKKQYNELKSIQNIYTKAKFLFDVDKHQPTPKCIHTYCRLCCRKSYNVRYPSQSKYFSLSKYIYKIGTLKNIYNNKSLDLIFIKIPITKLLLETFDLNICKNFIIKNGLYVNDKEAIINKTATITYYHFYNRILNNIHELYNFYKRYEKYSSRGYIIHIDQHKIYNIFLINIARLLKYNYNINIKTNSIPYLYIIGELYTDNNVIDFLNHYFIMLFNNRESIMQIVYHPNRINKLLEQCDIDDI